jgi:hypothetical protein
VQNDVVIKHHADKLTFIEPNFDDLDKLDAELDTED